MDRWTIPAIYLVMLLAIGALLGACGTYVDTTPPTSTLTDPPDYIFMNGPGARVMFRGTASDDTVGIKVEISFDDGNNWVTAKDDLLHSRFDWSYAATTGELSSGSVVIGTRATDNDGNAEAEQLWSAALVSTSSTPADLESFYASAGTVLYLSSGSGGAYGISSATGPALANTTDLIVVGSGYGQAMTTAEFSAIAATPATALATSSGSSYIFSVGADLTLKNLRITGGGRGASLSSPGPVALNVSDSVFEKQRGWGIYAEDTNGAGGTVQVNLSGVMIDASFADETNHGGVFLDSTVFDVSGSLVEGQQIPAGFGAGIYAQSGSGTIDSSVFFENGYAIWASGGSPVITSCNISGAAFTTNGINLTGGNGSALIRSNTIDGNNGYGLRVGGRMELILRNNAVISNNLSGILIDSELANSDLIKINMGTSTDKGNNLLDNNLHPSGFTGYETQVYVTQATHEGATMIPANWNYWGYPDLTSVGWASVDNVDLGGGRATLAIGSFWATPSGEVGP